jgi:N-acetyl-gamma-glutamyl-phosphate reductase
MLQLKVFFMVKTAIFGASGYTGAALVEKVNQHPLLTLNGVYVSANSQDANKTLSELHPSLAHIEQQTLIPANDDMLEEIANNNQVILLATPHEASHEWAPKLLGHHAVVYDLSGAYRLSGSQEYQQFYGFEHLHGDWLDKAVYGLAEHNHTAIASAELVAVPGCYPTASLCALLPMQKAGLLDSNQPPIINAVSGVSGAGRKAALTNSFCEVSLQAYGVFTHRHTPEIAQHLGQDVIFTPHLGSFKRGILATVTAKLENGVSKSQIDQAFADCYQNKKLIRLLQANPRVDDVAYSPFCDLSWHVDEEKGYVIVTSAIDNVLKGAATQAIQCINIRQGWADYTGLMGTLQ